MESTLTQKTIADWKALQQYVQSNQPVCIDGEALTIPQVIAVSLYDPPLSNLHT